MTPYLSELHQRSRRFHAEIARRAFVSPLREDRTFFIPNTPFGVPKVQPEPPKRIPGYRLPPDYSGMWFYNLVKARPAPDISRQFKINKIQRLVASEYGLSLTELLSERRTKELVRPRQIAMYLCKKLTTRSLPEIGRRFGGRDHTTVIHAVRKIEALATNDQFLAEHLQELTRKIMA